MRIFISFLILLNLSQMKAQVCDSIYPEDPSKLEKTAAKFKEKLLKGKEVTDDASLCFEIAQHLRRKGDTTASKLYFYACDLFKKDYSKEKKAETKAEILYKLGLCYFFCNNFKMADTWFSKAMKAKYPSPCTHYYRYLCLKSQGRNEEAEVELSNYKKDKGN